MTKNCNGWLKLHRKLLNWEWYHDTNTRLVFIHLLLTANYEPSTYKGKIIQEGQRVYNRNELANEVGISVQKLRTALDKLKATNEITITSTNKGSVLTIGKWGLYQDRDHASNQQNNPQSNQQKSNPLLNPLPNQQKSNKVTSKKTAKSTVNGGVIEIEEFRSNQQNNSELTSNLTRYSTSLIKDNKKLRREEDKKNYIKKREDENCEDGFIFEDVENSDQNELQGNLSKHSEIEPSFPETKGKSPKADKVENKQNLMVSKQVEQSPKVNGYSQDFLEFWNLYPVKGSNNGGAATKGSKKTAYKAWLKAFKNNNNLTLNEVKTGLQNYAKFLYGCSETGQQPCFQGNKHASTWINASGWEDEYTITTSRSTVRNPETIRSPEESLYEETFRGLDEIMRRERESAETYEALRGMRSV